ncbi:hypothetical protein CFP56_038441 [Quercus suber]|uniref:Uncharacterized protein n=1 Tax=Quercus suber TaxID=58331 RepID=A0AAW0J273_QUESU
MVWTCGIDLHSHLVPPISTVTQSLIRRCCVLKDQSVPMEVPIAVVPPWMRKAKKEKERLMLVAKNRERKIPEELNSSVSLEIGEVKI